MKFFATFFGYYSDEKSSAACRDLYEIGDGYYPILGASPEVRERVSRQIKEWRERVAKIEDVEWRNAYKSWLNYFEGGLSESARNWEKRLRREAAYEERPRV